MAPIARRLAGTLLYLAFLALCCEVVLQAYYYFTAGDLLFRRVGLAIYVPEEHAGFAVKPNLDIDHRTNEFGSVVYTNSQGFRVGDPDREFSPSPPPDAFRVLLLGPSFAFGWGVDYEDTFGAILESQLDRAGFRGADRVELINAGVPAISITHQLEWLRHEGVELEPDLVIQFVYGSMLPPRFSKQRYTVTPEGYLEASGRSRFRKLQTIAKNSALVFYGWTAYARIQALFSEASEGHVLEGAGRDLTLRSGFSLEDPEVMRALDFYDDMERTVEGAGAELLLVYFPLSYVVHPEDTSRWQHLDVDTVDRQADFNSALCTALRERGVECLNITRDLKRATASGERLYYWLDIHWTPRGNAVAAEAVAEHLLGRSEPRGRP